MVDCDIEPDAAGLDHVVCVFTSFVHGLRITTVDDEIVEMLPLQDCDATEITEENSDLCDQPEGADLTALLNDLFVAKNYLLDRLAGYTDLPDDGFSLGGEITVENGQVTSFTPTTTTPPSTPPVDPPVVDPGTAPVHLVDSNQDVGEIVTDDCQIVSLGAQADCENPYVTKFMLNVPTNATYVQFTAKPNSGQTGNIFAGAAPDFDNCASECIQLSTQYSTTETFWFVPNNVTTTQNDSFTFVSGNAGGESAPTTVDITVDDSAPV
jgi:hypothetical protein